MDDRFLPQLKAGGIDDRWPKMGHTCLSYMVTQQYQPLRVKKLVAAGASPWIPVPIRFNSVEQYGNVLHVAVMDGDGATMTELIDSIDWFPIQSFDQLLSSEGLSPIHVIGLAIHVWKELYEFLLLRFPHAGEHLQNTFEVSPLMSIHLSSAKSYVVWEASQILYKNHPDVLALHRVQVPSLFAAVYLFYHSSNDGVDHKEIAAFLSILFIDQIGRKESLTQEEMKLQPTSWFDLALPLCGVIHHKRDVFDLIMSNQDDPVQCATHCLAGLCTMRGARTMIPICLPVLLAWKPNLNASIAQIDNYSLLETYMYSQAADALFLSQIPQVHFWESLWLLIDAGAEVADDLFAKSNRVNIIQSARTPKTDLLRLANLMLEKNRDLALERFMKALMAEADALAMFDDPIVPTVRAIARKIWDGLKAKKYANIPSSLKNIDVTILDSL
jgi:hypothetical protein